MIGISTSSFYSKLLTEDAVLKIGDMGAKCVEVFLNTFSEYTCEYMKIIDNRVKEKGIMLNSVHTLPTQFEPQLFSISERQKQDAFLMLENVFKGAKEAGCNIYVMHGKPYYRKNTGIISLNRENLIKPLNELTMLAKKYDIKIALENVHWAMCNSLEFIDFVKKQVPDMGFTLDIKQAHLGQGRWQDYLTKMGDRLLNVHLCDYVGNKTCLVGKGEVDLFELKFLLLKIGYKGNVMLELYPNDYNTIDEVYECYKYCRNIFES